jgi:hypothetical protein
LRRVRGGVCEPLPPSEFEAWATMSGNIVYPREYAILRAVDRAFCAETNAELADYQARQREASEAESKKPRKGGWFRGKG